MFEVLMVMFLIVAIVLIGFIMIQQGKGADMGASFGSAHQTRCLVRQVLVTS